VLGAAVQGGVREGPGAQGGKTQQAIMGECGAQKVKSNGAEVDSKPGSSGNDSAMDDDLVKTVPEVKLR